MEGVNHQYYTESLFIIVIGLISIFRGLVALMNTMLHKIKIFFFKKNRTHVSNIEKEIVYLSNDFSSKTFKRYDVIANGLDDSISILYFFTHKSYENIDDYKDAYGYKILKVNKDYHYKFAISDGATISSFSKNWSDLLIKNFLNEQFKDIETLKICIDNIINLQNNYIKNYKNDKWWLQDYFITSAATFIGFEIYLDKNEDEKYIKKWKAFGIGDSCLILFRNNQLKISFPIAKSEDFGNTPILITNKQEINDNIGIWAKAKKIIGDVKKGDIFVLTTDGFAKWILKSVDKYNSFILNQIPGFIEKKFNHSTILKWVRKMQNKGIMEDDDITFIIIQV